MGQRIEAAMGQRLGRSAMTGAGIAHARIRKVAVDVIGRGTRRTSGRVVEKRKLREKDEGKNCHIGYPDAEASHECVYGWVIPR
jgi:hypothetical protein